MTHRLLASGARLLVQGRLFRDNRRAFFQWLKGVAITLVLLLVVSSLAGPVTGVIVASLAGGALQPWLFRDIKFR